VTTTTTATTRVSRDWLDLREGADAAARSRNLVERLLQRLPAERLVVHDLGSGSGSLGRWLAPQLPGLQRWVLHDRDPDLLAAAGSDPPEDAVVDVRLGDVTRLERDALADASLITASALLDLLTDSELAAVVDACRAAACPVLITLSVTGDVRLDPEDPLDGYIASAFNEHQQRETTRGRLLGPAAVEAAADAFRRSGCDVTVEPSPWRLGADEHELTAQWLAGWVGAACEQAPALTADAGVYLRRRAQEAAENRLKVAVGHADLLVLP
jgi:hypothetical protein